MNTGQLTQITSLADTDQLYVGRPSQPVETDKDSYIEAADMLPGNGHTWTIKAQTSAPTSPNTTTLWIDTN